MRHHPQADRQGPVRPGGCVRGYLKFLRSAQVSLTAERARFVKARADREELFVRQKEGSLLEAAIVEEQLGTAVIHFRQHMLALPPQLGREVEDPKTRARIIVVADRHVRDALTFLSDYDPRKAAEGYDHAKIEEEEHG